MNKRKRILIIGGGILVLALGVGAFVRSRPHDLVLIGVVDANEIVVTPPVQARLDSLWVEEGSEVKAGQPIATLDRGELAAQAQSAGASAASLRAQLEQASLSARQTAGEAASAVAAAQRAAGRGARRVRAAGGRARRASAPTRVARRSWRQSGGLSPSGARARDHRAARAGAGGQRRARSRCAPRRRICRRAEAGELAVRAARGGGRGDARAARWARAPIPSRRARGSATPSCARRCPASCRCSRRGAVSSSDRARRWPSSSTPIKLWVRVAAPESDAGAVAVGDSLEVRFPSGETTRGRVISKSAEGEFATQHDVSASKRDIRAVAFRVAIANPQAHDRARHHRVRRAADGAPMTARSVRDAVDARRGRRRSGDRRRARGEAVRQAHRGERRLVHRRGG